ncbi:hypothetical protein [Actinacidiphila acidipaludis]|uniref:Uncharacterized protein n=1 Tax=Actinacidiphila acidipaludis TaxID=2873382 RepID=A0ABS7QES1_9ACTN|nr:hypothetical protein [Streptomyces acidipaludis]MBY8881662.1 hypothetical protein [Streptomyces acidipaludis]
MISRRPAVVGRLIAALVFSELAMGLDRAVVSAVASPAPTRQTTGGDTASTLPSPILQGPLALALLVLIVMFLVALATVFVVPVAGFVVVWRGSASSPWRSGRWVTQYRLVHSAALTIRACAVASRASADDLPLRLREVARRLGVTSRLIEKSYRDAGSVRWPSHRRKALRNHTRRVVAKIRVIEGRLDRDVDAALTELTSVLITVCDRYVHGRIGALLDLEALEGLEPVRNWEWVRLVAALLACSGAAVGASFLPIPGAGLPYAIGGAAAAAFMLAYTDQPAAAVELWNRIGRAGG